MTLGMEKVRLTSENRGKVKELYTAAFEKKDRMPFALMCLMACLPSTEFLCFYDGDAVCGLAYLGKAGQVVYIMFLAVDEALRSQGFGGRILECVQGRYPDRKIIISFERCDVESADLEIRRRRKRFYLKHGYQETGYLIELGHAQQEIVVKNGAFHKWEFVRFFLLYSGFTLWPKIWRAGK